MDGAIQAHFSVESDVVRGGVKKLFNQSGDSRSSGERGLAQTLADNSQPASSRQGGQPNFREDPCPSLALSLLEEDLGPEPLNLKFYLHSHSIVRGGGERLSMINVGLMDREYLADGEDAR